MALSLVRQIPRCFSTSAACHRQSVVPVKISAYSTLFKNRVESTEPITCTPATTEPLSKPAFIKKKCMTFDDFVREYGDLAKRRGMKVNEAYQKMLTGQYNHYNIHRDTIDPGCIFPAR